MNTLPSLLLSKCDACLPAIARIFDELPLGLCLLDRDLRFVSINRWLADAHGVPIADHLGRSVRELLPAAYATIETVLHRALHGEVVDEVEVRLPANGAVWQDRVHLASLRPVFQGEGVVAGVMASVIDITRRTQVEAALRESEAFVRGVLDSSTDCVQVLDLDGRLEFMNGPGLCALEIEDVAPLLGKAWESLWAEEARPAVRAALASARAGGATRFAAFCPTARAMPKWWDVSVSPIMGRDGNPARLLATSRDITETKRVQDEFQETAIRLAAVLESTTDCIVVLDREWRFTYLNSRAAAMIARGRDLVGVSIWKAFPEAVGGTFDRHYRDALARHAPVVFEEFLPSLGLWLEVHAYPSPDGLSIFFHDVTERRRVAERLEHLSRHDPLTGLANRTLLRERLAQEGAGDGQTLMALLCLDLDGFKTINDTLGLATGDRVLVETAERLRACVRKTDTVARIGGDEFAVLLAGLDHPGEASALAQRIIAAFRMPLEVNGHPIVTVTSIGITLVPETGLPSDDILKNADIALHWAKAQGPGQVCFFEPGMDENLQRRQTLKEDLHGAVQRGEFILHYQPLVMLASGSVSGFEALVRWHHPVRGLVSPVDFIPLAEETGAVLDLGEWVLRRACWDAATWPGDIAVAVNLSPVQFRDPGLIAMVQEALAASGLAAHRLQLEITESVLLQDNVANLTTLHALRELGVKIAMDDFGTGYSSLGYLRRFPFDKIKIDRSFVGDLPDGAESHAIVSAVIGLGHSLCIATTAEGIETREQLERLRDRGCTEGQGYLFSRPVPLAQVRTLIDLLRGQAPDG